MAESSENELEIYKQRYETYRHLDRLRWQMFQISVGAGSLALAFARDGSASTSPSWWAFIVVGLLLTVSGLVMLKIGYGVRMNGQVLSKAAALIGDTDIPSVSKWWRSISFWLAGFLTVLGLALACCGLARYIS